MKTFNEFYSSLSYEEARNLALEADTSTQYLYQIATGRRNAGAGVIERLMRADDRITFEMMRRTDSA